MRIALLGTRGIPANYGGFETFAEELSTRLAARGHEVTVYCRERYSQPRYRGRPGALRRSALRAPRRTRPRSHGLLPRTVFPTAVPRSVAPLSPPHPPQVLRHHRAHLPFHAASACPSRGRGALLQRR